MNADTNSVPIVVDLTLLQSLQQQCNAEQLIWLSGYCYGLSQQRGRQNPLPPVQFKPDAVPQQTTITIVYGSQSGNSKKIANQLYEQAKQRGIRAVCKDLNDYNVKHLSKETVMIWVISTYGEGDPPPAAEEVYHFLHSAKVPCLEKTQFAVLALGDKSYTMYCKTGHDIDQRLEDLGAKRLLPIVECDVDYESPASEWINTVLQHEEIVLYSGVANTSKPDTGITIHQSISKPLQQQYTKKNPFFATLTEKIRLNGRGSAKETWHYEFSLEGSGLSYKPGDSLGIIAKNSTTVVNEILEQCSFSGAETIIWEEQSLPISEALKSYTELTTLTKDGLQRYAQITQHKRLEEILQMPAGIQEFCYGRDWIDVLREFPATILPQEFVGVLRKLQARLYSISSSMAAVGNEVHCTVESVRYTTLGKRKNGLCSTFLADELQPDEQAPVFIENNEFFTLPAPETDIIMIGPGTGVAPFRAFLQERELIEASGKNWLFFGNQHFVTDFLYQREWQQWVKKGILNSISLAFSRDSECKEYVQHKMAAQSKEVYRWLQNGASVYVCGDKNRMAKDVKQMFVSIVMLESGVNQEEAKEYVRQLQKSRRYHEDVY